MSDELRAEFVAKLWKLGELEELVPSAVAEVIGADWADAPPPSARHRWQRLEHRGDINQPFARIELAWQPGTRAGRLSLEPSRLVAFTRAQFDAAFSAAGASPGTPGVDPAPVFGSVAPFASARMTQLVYRVRAGRLAVGFENLALRAVAIEG